MNYETAVTTISEGDRLRETNIFGLDVTGVVSSITREGIFYRLDGSVHTYGLIRYTDRHNTHYIIEKAQQREVITEMDLKDLKKSISEMSDEELLAHVMGTRAARRHVPTQKRAAAKKEAVQRKVKHKQTAATNELSALFASLSPEQQAALLKQLEGGNK